MASGHSTAMGQPPKEEHGLCPLAGIGCSSRLIRRVQQPLQQQYQQLELQNLPPPHANHLALVTCACTCVCAYVHASILLQQRKRRLWGQGIRDDGRRRFQQQRIPMYANDGSVDVHRRAWCSSQAQTGEQQPLQPRAPRTQNDKPGHHCHDTCQLARIEWYYHNAIAASVWQMYGLIVIGELGVVDKGRRDHIGPCRSTLGSWPRPTKHRSNYLNRVAAH